MFEKLDKDFNDAAKKFVVENYTTFTESDIQIIKRAIIIGFQLGVQNIKEFVKEE
jgi:hypothetical protein